MPTDLPEDYQPGGQIRAPRLKKLTGGDQVQLADLPPGLEPEKKSRAELLGMAFAMITVVIPVSLLVCSAALWATVWLLTHLTI